jgi:hypothetical protein
MEVKKLRLGRRILNPLTKETGNHLSIQNTVLGQWQDCCIHKTFLNCLEFSAPVCLFENSRISPNDRPNFCD